MSIKRVCDFCGKLEGDAEFMLEKGNIHICGSCLILGYQELLSFKEKKRLDAEHRASGDANTA